MYLSGLDIQSATRGQWLNMMPDQIEHIQVEYIQTDSRHFKQNDAFLALRGPHFDGHLFAPKVANKASALIGDEQGIQAWADLKTPQLEVSDTLLALGDIAHAWRKKLTNTTVIAITGSYGKTTIRSMLAHTFKALGIKTTATHANLNNLIGAPMTLLGIDQDAEVALIECGISEIGEMQRLSEIVQPDIAILTGITSAHAEGLGGLHGVAYEKSLLLKHLRPQGWCALGEGVRKQLQNIQHHYIESFVDWELQGNQLLLRYHDESASLLLALPAPHWGSNMAFVASIAMQYLQQQKRHVSLMKLADILASWQPVQGRLQSISGINDCTILDDSYNANPVSMQAALHTLAAMPKRRIAMIGDMAELGDDAEHAHKQLDVSHIDMLILVGTHMYALHQQHPTSQWFASIDALLAWLNKHQSMFTAQDTILIKASHSMQLDQVVSLLAKQGDTHVI
ncbi:MAG: UDP-N-acetylmuramoyl-tripeptide--D-alanyl-D-alanine ligase [Proteobacteria bacterium]|nr:MAG: UDP-N-acetylmuramoyl-tripeptide--D-alanyl-D-alanine ligase [Pseudomonadota bacterium]